MIARQATNRDRNERNWTQIQRWGYAGCRQPGFALTSTTFPCLTLYLASYGSLARYKDVRRLHPVGNATIIGAGGDMSDFQHIQSMLDDLVFVKPTPLTFLLSRYPESKSLHTTMEINWGPRRFTSIFPELCMQEDQKSIHYGIPWS